jgi:hypothetical protein
VSFENGLTAQVGAKAELMSWHSSQQQQRLVNEYLTEAHFHFL